MRPIITAAEATRRLNLIFPRGAFDTVMSQPLAGHGVAALIYVDAIHTGDDDSTAWARPSTLTRLSDIVLSERVDDADRERWQIASARSRSGEASSALLAEWGLPDAPGYAGNSRETLRDETFRQWKEQGALRKRPGVPTSSGAPRWALAPHFADLFDPTATGRTLDEKIDAWQATHMSPGARLRVEHAAQRADEQHQVTVNIPGGGARTLEPGNASRILKGVIEEWAQRRLKQCVVLTVSEPGTKVLHTDDRQLRVLGITIDKTNVLPDAILADLGTEPVTFWIVEAVATDGPITEARKQQLLVWAKEQSIPLESCQFLTAFLSRGHSAAKRRLKDLAEDTFAWFEDEPGNELAWNRLDFQ